MMVNSQKKSKNYWTKETCYAEAVKYSSREEFKENASRAHEVARKNGWLDEYTWFITKQKPYGYWNIRENNEAEAQKYSSRVEFKKNANRAYEVARKNRWLDEYTWLIVKQYKQRWYWNIRENNKAEAQKYTSRIEFARKSGSAYGAALKNGWLDEYTWFRDDRFDIVTDKIDSVYAYEFKELNSVYIGRTLIRLQKTRDKQHIFSKDSVSNFAKKNNISIPCMKILEDSLTVKEGASKEGEWVDRYKKNGWKILNKAKTGSIGGLYRNKWNKKTCYAEAQKCKSRVEFQKKSGSAYGVARKNGWLDEYTWFIAKQKPYGYWNIRENNEAEAQKYSSRVEFEKNASRAYVAALKNGWIDEYTWFISLRHENWTQETCYAEAQKYSSRGEFVQKSCSAYGAALKNGWLDEYTWFIAKQKPYGYWTRETCYIEARKYTSRIEFARKSRSAYGAALKNGWLDEYTWFIAKQKPYGYWNIRENNEAEAQKYTSRVEFKKNAKGAYCAAYRNKWIDEYTWMSTSI